jgi:leucyl aminopeptidase
LQRLFITTDAVFRCRDLVNEPVKNLDATGLAEAFRAMGEEAGIEVEVLSKSRIEALRMGGLLGVNMGSVDPPTFTIMEYKPVGKVNAKPYILVGKGVVYDTGGISLKPSASMVDMKCDMAGAATVAASLFAIARAALPVWVVALMPATDNRPSGNAQVPGDVITMYDGTTVEVLNTDAEGRLILADALAYAKNYKPALVIDMATLTGAAQAAIGKYATVAMQSKAEKELDLLVACGARVHERIAEFPFWDDYKELLKSEVADLKNIGGAQAGAITAGKFLEHFTSYPYIHLDIAGPAFMDKRDSYRGLGGTGIGVRMLFEFFTEKAKKKPR